MSAITGWRVTSGEALSTGPGEARTRQRNRTQMLYICVAAGIGGGSADAAACLRALARLTGQSVPGPDQVLALGADVPVCLAGTPARMTGIGEALGPVPPLPAAWLVLANPGVAVSTPAIFRALARRDNAPMPASLPRLKTTADLAAFLCGRDSGVQRFALHLEHAEGADTLIPVGLLSAERDPAMLFELARGRLEQIQVPAPVRNLRLVAEDLPLFVPQHTELFDPRPQQNLPWEQLRERLRARLGDDAVQGLGHRADHRPERSWQPQTDPRPCPASTGLRRPGWLFSEPQALSEGSVRILMGPERIESGWWDGADVRRDYYLIETRSGQQGWAYREVGEGGPLWLQGWFA